LRYLDVAVGRQGGGEQVAVAAAHPANDVAGVLREQGEFTGGDVEHVGVHQLGVPTVVLHDRLAGQPLWERECCLGVGERCQVDHWGIGFV
jgi:hypothetical protein